MLDLLERILSGRTVTETGCQLERIRLRPALTQQQHDLSCLPWCEIHADLQGSTGVESGAEAPAEGLALKCRGTAQRAIAAHEFESIAGCRGERHAGMRKRHASRKFGVVRVGRQEGAAPGRMFGDNEALFARARRA